MAFTYLRIYRLFAFLIFIGCLLIIRLAYLQVFFGSTLAMESLGMRIQEFPTELSRGDIIDRNGLLLTNTAQQYSIILFPRQISQKDITAGTLSKCTGIPGSELIQRINESHHPFKLNGAVDGLTAQEIRQKHMEGVLVIGEKVRYGYSLLASHVIGYINKLDNQGVSGVEKMCDDVLKGSDAEYAAAFVDAGQNLIPGLGYKWVKDRGGVEASDVVLTLDKRVQKAVEDVMDRHSLKGAAIVIRPSTGEILAMASRPNFDGNRVYDYLSKDSSPLVNRAISAYQPGSVFKLVVAAAALEYGIVTPEEVFYDAGYINVDHHQFKGWDYKEGARGYLTFKDALAYSSNPVFIQVGLKLGGGRMISFAQKLGFGEKTNLGFEGEAKGNLPSPDNLYPAEVANLAIGQGEFEATPLQIVRMIAAIVNDGVEVEPYIISNITDRYKRSVKFYYPQRGVQVFSKRTAEQMRDMMTAVTLYGTGKAAFIEEYPTAGKTGTAETGRRAKDGQGISHAWFAGYAPTNTPQYAIVVFVEEGMSGGDVAAPIFSEIVKEILSTQ